MPGTELAAATKAEPRLPLWLTYMRQRRMENSRLGLVLGAGVSKDAGCPMWGELITRLTSSLKFPHARIETHRGAGNSETFIAEVVLQNYTAKQAKKNTGVTPKFRQFMIDASWREQIHKCLFQGIAKKPFSYITKRHIYLTPLAELICKSGFAVTFNFDDIVDEAVIAHAAKHGLPNPEIITRPKLETRKDAPTIYHINGYLPREELRRASEKIVLTENAFADILLSPNSHDAEFVINQFATKTFLLLGVSLSDSSLKNLLRSSANRNPANHHFIIYHEKDGDPRTADERRSGRVPPEMYLDDKTLTPKQQETVDNFLFPQLISKTNKMMSKLPGVRIMDRSFFDLFAFSKDASEVERKGKELRRRFEEMGKRFEDGHIFFLKASKDALNERMARRGSAKSKGKKKKFDGEALVAQEIELLKIYRPQEQSIFDTSDTLPGDTAKNIARAILLGTYTEFSFVKRLDDILAKGGAL